jgi:hypothetical protein
MLHRTAERMILLHHDSTGFTTIDTESEEVWQREFATIVTSLCLSRERVLAGLLTGVLKLYDNRGEARLAVTLPGSRVPIVFGCALGPEGRHIAAVGGLDPQRFVFIRIKDNGEPTVLDWPLEGDLRREVFVAFGKSGRYVFFEGDETIGVFKVSNRRLLTLPKRGELLGFSSEEEGGFFCLVSGDAREKFFCLYDLNGSLLYEEPITSEEVSLRIIGGRIILGYENRLIRIDVKRE